MVLMMAFPALAQKHETFAHRPSKRDAAVRESRSRAVREKQSAAQWARARGIKMRRADGHRVRELMAVRNGRPVYYGTKNLNAAVSTAADRVRNVSPYNLNGSGVLIGLWDSGGARITHNSFSDGRVMIWDGSVYRDHSTHVCGTLVASGSHPGTQGMAPSGRVDSYDWSNDVPEMTSRAASAPGSSSDLYLSNHSYGYFTGWEREEDGSYIWYGGGSWNSAAVEEGFGAYVPEAREWDEIVYDAPYFLPFKAAGNDRNDAPRSGHTVRNGESGSDEFYDSSRHPEGDGVYKEGYDTLGPVGTAKNIMTVGAVSDVVSGVSRNLDRAHMLAFSSWGPADDGRIKPDIVANGDLLWSTGSESDSDTFSTSGTSMSTPNACGSAALLVELYSNLFPGGAMRASTLKGLIIHTADDLGRPGPDYQYGWGLMNTLAAAELLTEYAAGNSMRLAEAELTTSNGSDTYVLSSSGAQAIRVTLCWTDPASSLSSYVHDSRTSRLVNDLDLTISGPSGISYPYSLSYSAPSENATTDSKNSCDNVEQVFIEIPAAGEYIITVDHDGGLRNGNQWYSLLLSGSEFDADSDGMPDFWEVGFFQSTTGSVAIADADGDGLDNLGEYVAGTDPTNAASVFAATGHFLSESNEAPFIISWNAVEGRVYSVEWAKRLSAFRFTDISGELPYPVNSYTDDVPRTSLQNYYRLKVKGE